MTISGPAIRAAKNPSSASTFIACPPLQLLRKSPRRSSSASVSGSFWVKVLIGIAEILGDGLRYHHRFAAVFVPQCGGAEEVLVELQPQGKRQPLRCTILFFDIDHQKH